ncbi:M14 family zinc carboxypeptidase [Metabacillus niabensis]|uniref:M14 family zinc carboxypeptidase n=1 Tax=Metabacillus niabensis TaxID=324854 RepID=UPI0039A18D70
MVKKGLLFSVIFLLLFGSNGHAEVEKPYTYKRMKQEVYQIAKQFHLEVKTFGKSEFGRDLVAVKVGDGKKSVLITASHHGREWLSTHIVMKMMKQYAKAYSESNDIYGHHPQILDDVSIWFVPMVNPDGVMIQQTGTRHMPFLMQEVYFDMNKGYGDFSRWKANGFGIDLNRQYPAGWEEIKGGQPYAAYSHYKGEKPFVAKESRALRAFTNQIRPLAAAAYHTSGRVIYWYYFNEIQHLQRDIRLVNEIAEKTGYEVEYPPSSAIGGGYTDWFIQTYKLPALTIELSYSVHETNPPLSVLKEEWNRNKEIGMVMASFAKNEFGVAEE